MHKFEEYSGLPAMAYVIGYAIGDWGEAVRVFDEENLLWDIECDYAFEEGLEDFRRECDKVRSSRW